ncbi:MAG: hypothetical protein AAF092_17460 [Pseudomonadota bacterium]
MGNKIDNANEYISGTRLFNTIHKQNINDFDVIGEEDSAEWLILENLRKGFTQVKDNPNIYYDGKSGYDTLEYTGGAINSVQMSVKDSDTIQIDGGYNPDYSTNGNQLEFNSLQVFATNVEQFNLTHNDDTVDLSGYGAAVSIIAEEGNDYIEMTDHNDTVDGGSGNDTIYGYDGNDTLDGGAGDDTIYAGEGNDTIIATEGANTVYGGAGNDIIYAHSDLGDTAGLNTIYGDWESGSGQAAGTFNQADRFHISYDVTSEPVYASFTLGSDSELTFDDAVQMGITQGISMLPGGNVLSMGINMANMYMNPEVVSGSVMVSAGGSTILGKTVIGDFDAFADTAVVSLGDYGNTVDASNPTANSGTEAAIFKVASEEFFRVELAEEQLSFMEFEDADGVDNISGHADDIVDNLLYNSLLIGRDAWGEIYVKSQYGVDYADDMTDAELDNFNTMIGKGEGATMEDGVWLVGDYGDSIMYGQDKTLAGTNSNNVMYSGSYVAPSNSGDDPDVGEWFSEGSVTMFGGLGNDTIFGGKEADDLYGNDGDDYLNGMGSSTVEFDHLYGGTGTDTASFETVYDSDDNAIGGYTLHGTSHGVFVDLTENVTGQDYVKAYAINGTKTAAWGDAAAFFAGGEVWNTSNTDASYYLGTEVDIAALHDIENVTGSD